MWIIIFGEGTLIKDTDSVPGGLIEFFITFSLSVFSASLGLAKCLKNGVAGPSVMEDVLMVFYHADTCWLSSHVDSLWWPEDIFWELLDG